jgi:hypothetical protein
MKLTSYLQLGPRLREFGFIHNKIKGRQNTNKSTSFCLCAKFICVSSSLCSKGEMEQTNKQTNKQTPWPLVRKRTIPTERPLLEDEI